MLSFIVRTALLLAAVCCLTCAESRTTCDGSAHRLSCAGQGVIRVYSAAYGRTDRQTCSEGRPAGQLANTACSFTGASEVIANRCNGRKSCEFDKTIFSDPCYGTFKYIQTTHKCIPANHILLCDGSTAELSCDAGQVISILGAFYGRNDRSTCIFNRPSKQIDNISCSSGPATQLVAKRCNGKRLCSISALNSQFGDPCFGTYKYLELGYVCDCPIGGEYAAEGIH